VLVFSRAAGMVEGAWKKMRGGPALCSDAIQMRGGC